MLNKPLTDYNGKDVLKFWLVWTVFKGFSNGVAGEILPYLNKAKEKLAQIKEDKKQVSNENE